MNIDSIAQMQPANKKNGIIGFDFFPYFISFFFFFLGGCSKELVMAIILTLWQSEGSNLSGRILTVGIAPV